VVSESGRTLGDQRAAVSCMSPAMAGPVTARPDQKTRLTRYIAHARGASAEVAPMTKARMPIATSRAQTAFTRPSLRDQRAEIVHDMPGFLRGHRLAVGRHHGAADHDVAVPVAVGALLLQL